MNPYLTVIFLTFLPIVELRGAIPAGIALGLSWPVVFVLAVLTNIAVGIIVWFLIHYVLQLAEMMQWSKRLLDWYTHKVQHKIDRYVEKYGGLALALFIAIPLPGSGVYSGALAGTLIGASTKQFIIAAIIGVLLSGGIVTAITLAGFAAAG